MIIPEKIILAPVLTEKSNTDRDAHHYIFRVSQDANKKEIMEAVRILFKVEPISCNIINVKPKPKRLRNRAGKTSSWKKAIVKLSSGDKIAIFEGA